MGLPTSALDVALQAAPTRLQRQLEHLWGLGEALLELCPPWWPVRKYSSHQGNAEPYLLCVRLLYEQQSISCFYWQVYSDQDQLISRISPSHKTQQSSTGTRMLWGGQGTSGKFPCVCKALESKAPQTLLIWGRRDTAKSSGILTDW